MPLLKQPFAECFLPREFARTAHSFGFLAGFLHGRLLEVLTLLQLGENSFFLALPLETAEGVLEALFVTYLNDGLVL